MMNNYRAKITTSLPYFLLYYTFIPVIFQNTRIIKSNLKYRYKNKKTVVFLTLAYTNDFFLATDKMKESNQSFLFQQFYIDFLLTMFSTAASRSISFPLKTMLFNYQNNEMSMSLDNFGRILLGADLSKDNYQTCVRFLYKGFGAKLIESTTKKSIKIILQPQIEYKLANYMGVWLEPMLGKRPTDIFLAATSGAIIGGCLFPAYPFEHLVNYQRKNAEQYSAWQVLCNENKYLLRGIFVAGLRSIVTTAIPFAVIEATKSEEYSELKALCISPLINILLTTPFDNVLERMQNKDFFHETARQSTQAIANQGWRYFYRGSGSTLFFKGVTGVLPILVTNRISQWYQLHISQ